MSTAASSTRTSRTSHCLRAHNAAMASDSVARLQASPWPGMTTSASVRSRSAHAHRQGTPPSMVDHDGPCHRRSRCVKALGLAVSVREHDAAAPLRRPCRQFGVVDTERLRRRFRPPRAASARALMATSTLRWQTSARQLGPVRTR
jgi:hypothetical protein